MTKEQQLITIAKACEFIHTPSEFSREWVWYNGKFFSGLNTMHEAEKTLKSGMRSKYDAELTIISLRDHNFIWETTADQRAEAFLRTIGKWEESK